MITTEIELAGGVVHEIPDDLRAALTSAPEVTAAWNKLTALGRNEFICWVEDVKKPETRAYHIERIRNEIVEGRRRPCCWAGCRHRERTGRA